MLANLKSSCAAHFGLPVSTCDILVSNNGPSCMNINQIPHRKDKVSNECITVLDHFGYFHVLLYPLEGSFGLTTIIKGKQGSVESLPKIESIRVGPVLLSLWEIWDQKRDFFHSKRDSDVTLDNVRQGRSGQQQQLHRNGRKWLFTFRFGNRLTELHSAIHVRAPAWFIFILFLVGHLCLMWHQSLVWNQNDKDGGLPWKKSHFWY